MYRNLRKDIIVILDNALSSLLKVSLIAAALEQLPLKGILH